MKKNHFLFVLILSTTTVLVQAQDQLQLKWSNLCNFDGEIDPENVYAYNSSSEAEAAVGSILSQYGITNRSFGIKAASVNNASAFIEDNKRYILYSEDFFSGFDGTDKQRYWWKMGILAHEIGHHIQGHLLSDGGSRSKFELEADEWAGFTLYRMGATLEQAQLAVRREAAEFRTSTHPGRANRLEAVKKGYNKARNIGEPITPSRDLTIVPNSHKSNQPTKIDPSVPQENLAVNYQTKVMKDGKRWTVENLDVVVRDSWCYDDDEALCEKYGRLYTWEAAKEACSKLGKGWRLPHSGDWEELAAYYGGYEKWYYKKPAKLKRPKVLTVLDPYLSNRLLKENGSSGFNALLGGQGGYQPTGIGEFGNYWCRDYIARSGSGKILASTVYFSGRPGGTLRILTLQASSKLKLSCRCVKDY